MRLWRFGQTVAHPPAPVLTPCCLSIAPREYVHTRFGIVKTSSRLNKCRHLEGVPAGRLSASYHSLTATHAETQSPLATLSPFISVWFYSLFHWDNLPCLLHPPGINAAKTDCRKRCALCWVYVVVLICCNCRPLLSSLQMCDCCSAMTIFSGKVLRSKSCTIFPVLRLFLN